MEWLKNKVQPTKLDFIFLWLIKQGVLPREVFHRIGWILDYLSQDEHKEIISQTSENTIVLNDL